MKRLPLALAPFVLGVVLPLALAGSALAQDQTPEQYVRGLVTAIADDDETLTGDIQVRELAEGDATLMTFALDPTKGYMVYGVCDTDCSDLDLFADDSDGEEFDRDERDDDSPMIFVLPGEAGDSLTIRSAMSGCYADTCVMAVAVYEQPS